MSFSERLQQLDSLLLASRDLWHPQPFRELRPAWCDEWPALHQAVLALTETEADCLARSSTAALGFLSSYLPMVSEIVALADLPLCGKKPLLDRGKRWAWEIPGRKQQQIEAFCAATEAATAPVLDWCGGKGHLGRLLALQWEVPVSTLEINPELCVEGEDLARRLNVAQEFMPADALTTKSDVLSGRHTVALHACGHLHRRLIRQGAEVGVGGFDLAPCCYHLGVKEEYPAFSDRLTLTLTADDSRLAVTETVTASPRLQRQRDKEMAWKLGFDVLRRQISGEESYQSFKPVPPAWFRGSFEDFLKQMGQRQGLVMPASIDFPLLENAAWQRQREVMRLSMVRSAFRRALELWMVLDMACFLQSNGYDVSLGSFCAPELTPRNVLISAR